MKILAWTTIGVLLGSLTTHLIYIKSVYGTLMIDQSNPEKDVYRIELGDLETLSKKKRIVLRIDTNADLSQN